MYTLIEIVYVEWNLCIHCWKLFTLSETYVCITGNCLLWMLTMYTLSESVCIACKLCKHYWKLLTFSVNYEHIAGKCIHFVQTMYTLMDILSTECNRCTHCWKLFLCHLCTHCCRNVWCNVCKQRLVWVDNHMCYVFYVYIHVYYILKSCNGCEAAVLIYIALLTFKTYMYKLIRRSTGNENIITYNMFIYPDDFNKKSNIYVYVVKVIWLNVYNSIRYSLIGLYSFN